MNYSQLFVASLDQFAVVIICLICLVSALRSKIAPAAALWAAAGFFCAILIAAWNMLNVVWGPMLGHLASSVRAASYVMLFVAVFSGRKETGVTDSQPLWNAALKNLRERPGLRSLCRAMAILTFVMVFLGSVAYGLILPEIFRSTARVALVLQANPGTAAARAPWQAVISPALVRNECEIIQSSVVLDRVIEQLGLNEQWGKKYSMGNRLRTFEVRDVMKRSLSVRPVGETSLIAIDFESEQPNESALISNTIAEQYQKYRQAGSPAAGASTIEIVDPAQPTLRPIWPKQGLYVLGGLWGGIWLGILVAVAIAGTALKYPRSPTPVADIRTSQAAI
jgi:capsular polysaccharide biosynthesis protein